MSTSTLSHLLWLAGCSLGFFTTSTWRKLFIWNAQTPNHVFVVQPYVICVCFVQAFSLSQHVLVFSPLIMWPNNDGCLFLIVYDCLSQTVMFVIICLYDMGSHSQQNVSTSLRRVFRSKCLFSFSCAFCRWPGTCYAGVERGMVHKEESERDIHTLTTDVFTIRALDNKHHHTLNIYLGVSFEVVSHL